MILPGKRVLILAIALAGPTHAGQLEDGIYAYSRGEFEVAFRSWRPLAEQGNAVAQFNLGQMFRQGEGVQKDDFEAVKWWRLAAEQNLGRAQYNLGVMYDKGYGVQQDDIEALKWWRRAAEQGVSGAQNRLGVRYMTGTGVPKDFVHALMWFILSASQGDADGRRYREAVVGLTSPDQIAEAKQLASDWNEAKQPLTIEAPN